MERTAVLLGLLLIVIGMLGRLPERIVTGLGALTLCHAVGLGLIVWAAWRARGRIAAFAKSAASRRYLVISGAIAWLLLALALVYAVHDELEAGRHYDRIRKALERDAPDAALDLRTFVRDETNLPLKLRMIERIGELGNPHREVVNGLLTALREDERPEVRAALVRVLGELLRADSALEMIAALPTLEPPDRAAYGQALDAWAGTTLGPKAPAWRAWIGETWAGTRGEEGLSLALAAYREFPGDPDLRQAALDRIGFLAGEDRARLGRLLADRDPDLRTAAAKAVAVGRLPVSAREIAGILKGEADAAAARAQVNAIVTVDAEDADEILLDVARTARGDVAREAATRQLAGGVEIDGEDPTALAALVFRRAKGDADRRRRLDDLVRTAGRGPAARAALLDVARDAAEAPLMRSAALRGLLAVEDGIADADLVGILEASPDAALARSVRSELRTRTGKDGDLDAEAWRRILEEGR